MENLNYDAGKNSPPPDNVFAQTNVPLSVPEAPPPETGDKKIPKIPPAASQGWYKQCITENDKAALSNAKIYSMVANNPLQRPDEIQKPKAPPQATYNPLPVTNPMPQRTRMYTYQRPYAPSSMRYS